MKKELLLFDDRELLGCERHSFQQEMDSWFARSSKTKQRKLSYQNINLTHGMKLVGKYDMPEVKAYTGDIPVTLTPYSMKDSGNKQGALHFFIDDYRFLGMYVWGSLPRFTEKIAPYKMVIGPDFSLYLDQSFALNLFQIYQNRVTTAYWQSVGLQVIPSVSWGNADSFEYCFEGLPQQSVLSIGGMGNAHHASMTQLWEYGVYMTIEHLNPIALIIYGAPAKLDLPVKTYYHNSFIKSKFN